MNIIYALSLIITIIATPCYGNEDRVIARIADSTNNPITSANPMPVLVEGIGDTLATAIDNDNPLFVHPAGEISTLNSTSATLLADAVYTGTAEDIRDESVVIISVIADVGSAEDGLSIQFSPDGTNWDHSDAYTLAGGAGKTFSFQPAARYFRVVYTNGGTDQAYFRLQSQLKSTYVKPSSHRVADSVSGQDDAELVKAIISGENPGGTFVNFTSTTAGNFKISLEEFDDAVKTTNEDRTTNLDGEDGLNTNAMLFARVDDDTVKNLRLDQVSEFLIAGSYEHHEAHEGSLFHAHYTNTVTNTGEMSCIGLNVPDTTTWPHVVYGASASAAAMFNVYRSPSVDVDEGTQLAIYNHNENSTNTSILTSIETTPVANKLTSYDETQAAGANITKTTAIIDEQIGSSGNPTSSSGGQARGSSERILKQGLQYIVCLTALDSNDNVHNLSLDWYEHQNRN